MRAAWGGLILGGGVLAVACSLTSLDGFTGGGGPSAEGGSSPGAPPVDGEAALVGDGAEAGLGAAANTGYILSAGGNDDTHDHAEVFLAAPGADGALGAWTAATPLPVKRKYAQAGATGGLVIVTAGEGSSSGGSSFTARPSDGGIPGWTASSPIAPPRIRHGMAARAGVVYVVAGESDAGLDDVQLARVDANGLGAFSTASKLPVARTRPGVAITARRLYTFGGSLNDDRTTEILSAPLDAAGQPAAFAKEALALPTALEHTRAIAVSDTRILVVGGDPDGAQGTTDVLAVDLDATTGAVTAVRATLPLPAPTYQHGLVIVRDHVYVVGGRSQDKATANVYFASVTADGVGPWRATTPLPIAVGYHAVTAF